MWQDTSSSISEVAAGRNEQRGLVQLRNELVSWLRGKAGLPEPISHSSACSKWWMFWVIFLGFRHWTSISWFLVQNLCLWCPHESYYLPHLPHLQTSSSATSLPPGSYKYLTTSTISALVRESTRGEEGRGGDWGGGSILPQYVTYEAVREFAVRHPYWILLPHTNRLVLLQTLLSNCFDFAFSRSHAMHHSHTLQQAHFATWRTGIKSP